MGKNKHDPVFIPCGDSLEKMNEISEEQLEQVSGGTQDAVSVQVGPNGIELSYDE